MGNKKITIIIFSGELDKALAAFNIATGAATMGMDVTMFFTFWGLNIIRKDQKPKSKGVLKKLLSLMNKGGTKHLPLSRFHMLGIGQKMMRKLMKDSKIPSVDEMIVVAKELSVKFVACTTTMGLMDITKETLIEEVDAFAGVATYIDEAKDGQINLFI
ncbi:MAG: DsrE/DsrF/DrsH-like family protein [Candidatus Poribacteria bacterium]